MVKLIRAGVFALLLFAVPALAVVGGTQADCQSIATGARLDIQPGAGVEWDIHNVYFTHQVTLERFDGTDNAAFATYSGPGRQNFIPALRVTNTNRLRVLNDDASSRVICYDAVITKE